MPNGSMLVKLREDERRTRHDLILESANTLIEETPFSEINVRKIAEYVGIAPASIYRYFSDRDDLLCEILIKKLKAFKGKVSKKVKKESLSQEKIIAIVIDYLLENESTFRMLCYFLVEREVSGDASHKFFSFLSSLESELGSDNNSSTGISFVLKGACYSSLIGTLIFFYNYYPNLGVKDKKELTHKVARKISALYN